jgi:hypothetical protein
LKTSNSSVSFEVVAAVNMKNFIFCAATEYVQLKNKQTFWKNISLPSSGKGKLNRGKAGGKAI